MNGVWCVYSSGASVYFPSYQQLVPGGMSWLEAFDSVIPVMCCRASVWICHPLGWMMDTSVCCEEDRRIGWGGGRGRKSPSLCRALGERVESGYKALLGHLLMTQTQLEKLWKKLLKLGTKGNNYGKSNHQTMVKHLVLHAAARLSCFLGPWKGLEPDFLSCCAQALLGRAHGFNSFCGLWPLPGFVLHSHPALAACYKG